MQQQKAESGVEPKHFYISLLSINFIMIVGFEPSDITTWKEDLQSYQHRKRTLFPPQPQAERQFLPAKGLKSQPRPQEHTLQKHQSSQLPSRSKVKLTELDRSLQKYMSKQFNYEKPYDIISLHPLGEAPAEPPVPQAKQNKAPIRNIYNLINGERFSDEYLKERVVILPPQRPKKELDRSRDFNIINLEYRQNGTAHQQVQPAALAQHTGQRPTSHAYDNIYNRFYNPQEEERYWRRKKEESLERANENFDAKLPPTYQTRQRYIQDYSKPLPECVQRLERRHEAYKRSHQAQFLFEERYKRKNVEEAERRESMMFRRFHRKEGPSRSTATAKIKSLGFDA